MGTSKPMRWRPTGASQRRPDIPTVDEAGLPGFHFSHLVCALYAKNTRKTVIGKLNAAVVEALNDLAVRQRLVDLEQEISSP